MKTITTKISALLVLIAVSAPGYACPSSDAGHKCTQVDTLSEQDIQRVIQQFEASV